LVNFRLSGAWMTSIPSGRTSIIHKDVVWIVEWKRECVSRYDEVNEEFGQYVCPPNALIRAIED
jgi:hypothetical protein